MVVSSSTLLSSTGEFQMPILLETINKKNVFHFFMKIYPNEKCFKNLDAQRSKKNNLRKSWFEFAHYNAVRYYVSTIPTHRTPSFRSP